MECASLVTRGDDVQRAAVEREDVRLAGFHLFGIPGEDSRLGTPVRPGRARELLLAGAAEVCGRAFAREADRRVDRCGSTKGTAWGRMARRPRSRFVVSAASVLSTFELLRPGIVSLPRVEGAGSEPY